MGILEKQPRGPPKKKKNSEDSTASRVFEPRGGRGGVMMKSESRAEGASQLNMTPSALERTCLLEPGSKGTERVKKDEPSLVDR